MQKKNLIKKGIRTGVVVFIVLEAALFGYSLLVMKLVPSGSAWSPMAAVLTGSLKISQWIVHFLSRIFWIFGGSIIKSSAFYSNISVVILRAIDLLFWIGISTLVLYKRDKQSSLTK